MIDLEVKLDDIGVRVCNGCGYVHEKAGTICCLNGEIVSPPRLFFPFYGYHTFLIILYGAKVLAVQAVYGNTLPSCDITNDLVTGTWITASPQVQLHVALSLRHQPIVLGRNLPFYPRTRRFLVAPDRFLRRSPPLFFLFIDGVDLAEVGPDFMACT